MNPVETALVVGGVVAAVSGPVGVFTVMRGQSFAGHALADIGATGGSAAYLAGVDVVYGFVSFNVLAAGAIDWSAGTSRRSDRDVTTGVVLGAALGLAALFLHWQTQRSTTQATITVLFGSIFAVTPSTVMVSVVGAGAVALLLAALWRPLTLLCIGRELATARGVAMRRVQAGYLVALAAAVTLSALTVGAALSTALLVGPAAAALHLTSRPGRALVLAAAIGVAATGAGIGLAYESYYWPPVHHGWPASFLIVAMVAVAYVGSLCSRD